MLMPAAPDDLAADTQPVKRHNRRKPTGRKALPEHLPRREHTLLPAEVEREGVDAFDKIGEEITEVLERRPPASMLVGASPGW